MRDDNNFAKIKVKVGPSENEQIVMFRCTEAGKYTKNDADNPDLLNEIVLNVECDFITKCIKLLETCSTVPSSLYTYDFFNKMYAIEQSGDVTASHDKDVYHFLISDSEDIDLIVNDIYVGYFNRNSKYSNYPFVIKELVNDFSNEKKDLIHRMFGGGEFPFLKVKYAWHEGRSEWHYAYHIVR